MAIFTQLCLPLSMLDWVVQGTKSSAESVSPDAMPNIPRNPRRHPPTTDAILLPFTKTHSLISFPAS